jgi:hypothetical protein
MIRPPVGKAAWTGIIEGGPTISFSSSRVNPRSNHDRL